VCARARVCTHMGTHMCPHGCIHIVIYAHMHNVSVYTHTSVFENLERSQGWAGTNVLTNEYLIHKISCSCVQVRGFKRVHAHVFVRGRGMRMRMRMRVRVHMRARVRVCVMMNDTCQCDFQTKKKPWPLSMQALLGYR